MNYQGLAKTLVICKSCFLSVYKSMCELRVSFLISTKTLLPSKIIKLPKFDQRSEKCYLKDYIVLDLSVLGNLLELGFDGIWWNYILEILEVFFVRKIKL